MDPSKLADRVRGILIPPRGNGGRAAGDIDGEACSSRTDGHLEDVLAGEWRDQADGRCFVVERRVDGRTMYGHSSVAELAARVEAAAAEAPLLGGGGAAHPPFVFFDLETTGLSGGAG